MAEQAKTFTHGPEFQRQVLRLMTTDLGFCARVCNYLKEDYFAGELKWFFRMSKRYYDEFNALPNDAYFKHEILKLAEGQQHENERRLVAECEPERGYISKELTGFIRANIFIGSYREAAGLYNDGNKDDAYDFTLRKLQELQRVDFTQERVTRFGDWEAVLDAASSQASGAVPTGILAIDEAMGGGMLPQTWTTFLGPSNTGKSMLGPNLALAALHAGKRTFVTIHEDEEKPTKLRYLARFSGIPYNRLTLPRSQLDPAELELVSGADNLLSQFVVLRFMYGKESYLESVQDAVRMLKKEWNFHLFYNDYAQCLKTKMFKNMDDSYNMHEFIYGELKQLCLELDIAGAGGAQVNRTAFKVNKSGSDFVRCSDVSDSFGIVKKASNVITLNRSDADARLNRAVFLLDKVRNGRCPVAVEVVTDYSRCMTYQQEMQREIPVAEGVSRAERQEGT
jgi:hypothetical protein